MPKSKQNQVKPTMLEPSCNKPNHTGFESNVRDLIFFMLDPFQTYKIYFIPKYDMIKISLYAWYIYPR